MGYGLVGTNVMNGSACILWHGHKVQFDTSGGLILNDETLLIADLHLGKGDSLSREGKGLYPGFDSLDGLQLLENLVASYPALKRVIFLGDSFHRPGSAMNLDEESSRILYHLNSKLPMTFVLGNHDPFLPYDIAARQTRRMLLDNILLGHEPIESPWPMICGHLHPVVKIRVKGRSFRRRSFFVSEQHLICPAMGRFSGGINVTDNVFKPFRRGEISAWLLSEKSVVKVPHNKWIEDRPRRL